MTERTFVVPRWLYLGNGTVLQDKGVLVAGNRITAILDADATPDARRVQLPREILLPGLINMHTHAGAGTVGRAISEDYELPTGMPFYVPLSRLWRLAYEERFKEAFRSVVEWDVIGMLRSGTTTILNHASTDVEGYLELAERIGVRTFTGPTIPLDVTHRLGQLTGGREDRPTTVSEDIQRQELDGLTELFDKWDGRGAGRITMLLGPAAVHTDEFSVLAGVGRLARRLDCLVTTHLCQAPSELAITQQKYGKTPLRVLQDADLANERLIAAHGTYMPDADLDLAAHSGITIVHCASRKAKEALISPSIAFADAGIKLAYGTDGFSSDLLEELKMAAVLGKIGVAQSHRPTAVEVFDTATRRSADHLGSEDLGAIREGGLADMIAVDLSDPILSPVLDPMQSLVYYSNGRDVDFVMIDGQVIVEERQFRHIDVAGVRRRAESALAEIWQVAIDTGLLADVLPSMHRATTEAV